MATFYNQASLSYGGTITNSNLTEAELISSLTVTKTALIENYSIGGTVVYAISIRNGALTDVCTLSLTDDLGAYTFNSSTLYPLRYNEGSIRYYLNGEPTAPPTVTQTEPLEITNISVPGESNLLIIYEATITEYAPRSENSTITNTLTATGCCLSEPLITTATIGINATPSLTIAKSVCPDAVVGCGEITYTFVIQNSGNKTADASDEIVVCDQFNPKFESISVTVDGQPVPETVYSYDAQTGQFCTTPGALIVPAATSVQTPDGSFTTTPGVTVIKVTGVI